MSITTTQFKMVMNPETAAEWLANYKYEHQRGVSIATVRKYADAMKKGEWIDNGETLILAQVNGNGQRVVVDGQHRLGAVVASGCAVPFTINEVLCSGASDLAQVYYTIDRNRTRSVYDAYRTMDLAAEFGITATWLNAAGASVQLICADFDRPEFGVVMSTNQLLEVLRDYRDPILAYVEAASVSEKVIGKALKRAAVMGVALATLKYSVSTYGELCVLEFWEGIARDDGLRQGDPRKVAHTHLVTTTHSTRVVRGTLQYFSAQYSARYIANCFNAWVERRTYKVEGKTKGYTKVFDASAPIKINGTPWKGAS